MTKHVQNNIKNQLICPAIEQAMNENYGKWIARESIFNFVFNTIFGAAFGPNFVIPLDDEQYVKYRKSTKFFLEHLGLIFALPLVDHFAAAMFWECNGLSAQIAEAREVLNGWIERSQQNAKTGDEFNSYVDIMVSSRLTKDKAIANVDASFQGALGIHSSMMRNIHTTCNENM